MILRRAFLVLSLVLGLSMAMAAPGGLTTPAAAQASESGGFVSEMANRAFAIMQVPDKDSEWRKRQIRVLMRDTLDLTLIARFVIGGHWDGLTPEQQNEYVDLFTEHMLNTYAPFFDDYTGEVMKIVSESRINSRDMAVNTKIGKPGGSTLNLVWRVRQYDSRYRVVDLTVEGISMVLAQRAEITSVIRNSGFESLLKGLRKRAES